MIATFAVESVGALFLPMKVVEREGIALIRYASECEELPP